MAIVALIPSGLGRRLNRLRHELGPDGEGDPPAHIPLVEPFRAEPSFLPLEQPCWRVCHDAAPFWVELGPLAVDPGERLVYAEVPSGGERLAALREALLTGQDAPPRDDTVYQPRAAVARLKRPGDVALAERETVGVETTPAFFLERVELMAQYPDGAWYKRDFYTLDRAVTRA